MPVCDAAVLQAAVGNGRAFAWDEDRLFYPVGAWAVTDRATIAAQVLSRQPLPRRWFLQRAAKRQQRESNIEPPDLRSRDGVVVPLPSSPDLKPWLYIRPEDEHDYLRQLDTFIRDEIDTGALEWAVRVEERGYRLFVLAPYGFAQRDPAEHERLLAAAGPDGWNGVQSRFQSEC